MKKTILLTGATDGIGLETAKRVVGPRHCLLIHGRNEEKLSKTAAMLTSIGGGGIVETYRADLSIIAEVEAMADAVAKNHGKLDVLINNAGVFKTAETVTPQGYDIRFVVNLFAPYLLTQRLLPLISFDGRIINLSSAAQAPVDLDALGGNTKLSDNAAYAQSKLALTMWSAHLAQTLGADGPVIVAVNPGSLLATNMVKDAYGMDGNDIGIGADILVRAALSDEFANATGQYFDNDSGRFAPPHPDALDAQKNAQVVATIEAVLARFKV